MKADPECELIEELTIYVQYELQEAALQIWTNQTSFGPEGKYFLG